MVSTWVTLKRASIDTEHVAKVNGSGSISCSVWKVFPFCETGISRFSEGILVAFWIVAGTIHRRWLWAAEVVRSKLIRLIGSPWKPRVEEVPLEEVEEKHRKTLGMESTLNRFIFVPSGNPCHSASLSIIRLLSSWNAGDNGRFGTCLSIAYSINN